MSITENTTNEKPLYYHWDYLSIQGYKELYSPTSDLFDVYFSIENGIAKSLSNSPFGGIFTKASWGLDDLKKMIESCENDLRSYGVQQVQIIQPSAFYSGFVGVKALKSLGCREATTEQNHFIDLTDPILLHEMQKRHLSKKPAFEIRKSRLDELPRVYDFIATCRKDQNLQVNISLQKLHKLFATFPLQYEAFVAEQSTTIISAVIMVRVTSSICYYYLPATKADFKKLSPMVHLLNYLYGYYRNVGFVTMDLGVSSINGQAQTGLAQFKERMGGRMTDRVTMVKRL